jgi:Fe2+ or Zn2+ uptake regulation protein
MRPQEIIDQAGKAADAATVHRFMRLLEELGLIHRIASAEGWMRCMLDESGAEGHDEGGMEHLLCSSCGKVQEIHLSGRLLELARTSALQEGFSAEAVSLEISGTCSACA